MSDEVRKDKFLLFVQLEWLDHLDRKLFACAFLLAPVHDREFADPDLLPHLKHLWNGGTFVVFQVLHPSLLEVLVQEEEFVASVHSLTMADFYSMPVLLSEDRCHSQALQADYLDGSLQVCLIADDQGGVDQSNFDLAVWAGGQGGAGSGAELRFDFGE